MSSPVNTNNLSLLNRLAADFPDISFVKSDGFRWDPKSKNIHYSLQGGKENYWSLFHEMGHMLLDHTSYPSDLELLKMEVLAWKKAKALAKRYSLYIDQDYIEKCLDSYRDWLHARSKCRRCEQAGLEKSPGIYECLNCRFTWKVSPERFCRVYRKKIEPS